jgi:hypothetical protein
MSLNDFSTEEINSLLEIKIDENTSVKDASFVQFVGWALKKVNNLNALDPVVQEVLALSRSFPSRNMPDEKKIDILLKLKKLNVI